MHQPDRPGLKFVLGHKADSYVFIQALVLYVLLTSVYLGLQLGFCKQHKKYLMVEMMVIAWQPELLVLQSVSVKLSSVVPHWHQSFYKTKAMAVCNAHYLGYTKTRFRLYYPSILSNEDVSSSQTRATANHLFWKKRLAKRHTHFYTIIFSFVRTQTFNASLTELWGVWINSIYI